MNPSCYPGPHQQTLGLNVSDRLMQKIRPISEIEKIMNRPHEQKCCVMTNFDGIRCRVSPSGISYPHSKIHVLASAEPLPSRIGISARLG
jgi:hypothetical protein